MPKLVLKKLQNVFFFISIFLFFYDVTPIVTWLSVGSEYAPN